MGQTQDWSSDCALRLTYWSQYLIIRNILNIQSTFPVWLGLSVCSNTVFNPERQHISPMVLGSAQRACLSATGQLVSWRPGSADLTACPSGRAERRVLSVRLHRVCALPITSSHIPFHLFFSLLSWLFCAQDRQWKELKGKEALHRLNWKTNMCLCCFH